MAGYRTVDELMDILEEECLEFDAVQKVCYWTACTVSTSGQRITGTRREGTVSIIAEIAMLMTSTGMLIAVR